jgi:hypothetical protein
MLSWLLEWTSSIRWALLALGITASLFVFEGSGMLSHWTQGHPRLQLACRWTALGIFLLTAVFAFIWWRNPTSDNMPTQLGNIDRRLSSIEQILTDTNDKLDRLIVIMEAQSGNTTRLR